MTPQPHEPPKDNATYSPLDAELEFTVTATIKGITGPLHIKAQRVSTIARTIDLLQHNGLLVEQSQASSTSGDEVPMCPDHQKPMKKGQYGWFCPRKTVDGEFCKQRSK